MVSGERAWDSTYVMVTSDHGGTRKGHGKNSLAEIQIPWIMAGPGIAAGHIDQTVHAYDTAATLAAIFDVQAPQCWTGRPVAAVLGGQTKTMMAVKTQQRGCVLETIDGSQIATKPVESPVFRNRD